MEYDLLGPNAVEVEAGAIALSFVETYGAKYNFQRNRTNCGTMVCGGLGQLRWVFKIRTLEQSR